MARCTAPSRGHRTASGKAACPACRESYRGYRTNTSPYSSSSSNYGRSSYGGGNSRSRKPRWSSPSSGIYYTQAEIRTLEPVRENIEKRSIIPDLRDVFLCHAWDDRKESAKQLHDLLQDNGVSVWFSEKDVLLGSSLLREIDKGLANSRIGIVLVTPSFIERIKNEGIAEKELSTLLARDLLVPIIHNTTFDKLRDISPLLGSRSGLSTNEESMPNIALKLAELIVVENESV
jgi:hypothetical protein